MQMRTEGPLGKWAQLRLISLSRQTRRCCCWVGAGLASQQKQGCKSFRSRGGGDLNEEQLAAVERVALQSQGHGAHLSYLGMGK